MHLYPFNNRFNASKSDEYFYTFCEVESIHFAKNRFLTKACAKTKPVYRTGCKLNRTLSKMEVIFF